MSHIESVKVTITDLEALKDACTAMGVEFVQGKKEYNWFGQSVGDHPLPAGFAKEDLGKCDHVIRVPGVNYEVGVVKARAPSASQIEEARKTGTPIPKASGFTLLYDFWGSAGRHDGSKLKAKFGDGLTKLVDEYSLAALKRKAAAKGYLTTTKVVDGKIHLTVRGF